MEKPKVVALIAILCLGVMASSLISPIEVRFVQSLTKDPSVTGLIFSVGTILIALFSIYLGRLSLKYGKRKIALAGLATGIIYSLIYATSFSAFQYFVGRVAWAFTAAAFWNMTEAIFQDEIAKSKKIAEIYGFRYSVQSLAGIFGSLAGGYLADLFGLRVPYFIITFIYILALSIFLKQFLISEEKIEKKVKKRKISKSIKDILSNPFLLFRLFTESISQSYFAMEPIVLPLLVYSLTKSNFATGIVFSAMGLVGAVFFPVAGKFVDKTTPITGLKLASALCIISSLIIAFGKSYSTVLVGALILSLGHTFNGPSKSKIETKNIRKEFRGEYLGYLSAYDLLANAISAFATGILLRFLTPNEIFLVFAIFTFFNFSIGYTLLKIKLKNRLNRKLDQY